MCRAELQSLSRAVVAITQQRSVHDVLQMVVTAATELIGAAYGALGIPDDSGSFAEFYAAGVSDELWERIGPLPRTHGLLGVMLRQAEPQRLPDIRVHPDFEGWPSAHPVLKDFLGMPIVEGERTLGAIYLANKTVGGGFTDDDEALLRLLAAHAAIALENARLNERSRELALVEERTRLARDLHDAVSQKLFSLRLTADAAATRLREDPDAAAHDLSRVQQLAREAAAELRAVLTELRPPALSEDGLVAALCAHVETLRRTHAVPIELVTAGVGALPADLEDGVYRIAQEAVHNAVRHAAACRIEVDLRRDGDRVTLEVRDDGRGFDPVAAEHGADVRLGLVSMRERADRLRGRLDVTATPGRGSLVRLEVPVR